MASKVYGIWITGGALPDRWLTQGNGVVYYSEFDNLVIAQMNVWKERALSHFEIDVNNTEMTAEVKEIGFDGEPKPRVP